MRREAAMVESIRSRRGHGLDRRHATQGILHRQLGLHRLQSVRGGVQRMERHSRGRARDAGHVLRQHGCARGQHLASRGVHRATPAAGRSRRLDTAPNRCRHIWPELRSRGETGIRWLMSSDVCKHCTHAACLDVCPTGALMRTEFGTVVVQDDVCNGCGYCIPACPFGVIDRRRGPPGTRNVGIAQKCTLCYDRLGDGLLPRAPRPVPRSPSSSGTSTSCAFARSAASRTCASRASPTHGSTAPIPMMASAAPVRSSCFSTSPRCTACRPTPW